MAKKPLGEIFGTSQVRPPLTDIFSVPKPQEPGYLERVGSQFQKAGQRAISGINEGAQDIQEGDKLGGVRAGLRTVGSVAGAAFAPIMEIPVVKKGIEAVMEKATEVPAIQKLATKGLELSQKYPQAAKDIEDIVNIGTLGLGQAASKPIQSLVTDSAKSVAKGAKNVAEFAGSKAKGLVPESSAIMNRVARLKPTDAKNFEKLAGKTHGQYLTETGNFGSPDKIITKEAEKFTQSLNDVDNEIAKLPGLYKNGGVDDMLSGLIEKAKNTSGDNVQSPYLQQVIELNNKNLGDGLSMEDINTIKRLYERNVKLGYNKLVNGDKVEQATNIDNAVRTWQVKQAERLGFTNLPELNKQTQLSKFIVDKLGDQVVGQTGLNGVGLTDWIMLSGGDPTAVSGFLVKKFFSDKGIQSRIAKMLNKGEIKGQIKPEVKPINYNPLQLGEPSIKLPGTNDKSSVKIIPAEKTLPTQNPKTGRLQKTYSSSSKPQSPQSPKIQSEKALPKASTTSPIKSSPKVKGTIPENSLIQSVKDFAKSQGIVLEVDPIKNGDVYIKNIESKVKGGGTAVIKKIFENTEVKSISGDSTKEALGFWKKMGAEFLDKNRIDGGEGSRFVIRKSPENTLISEAKKYKSAEEFVKAQKKTPLTINIKDIKSSWDADTFASNRDVPLENNIGLLSEYKSKINKIEESPVGREITKPIEVGTNINGGSGYRIYDGNHRYLQALKNGASEIKAVFREKELINIWKKANK